MVKLEEQRPNGIFLFFFIGVRSGANHFNSYVDGLHYVRREPFIGNKSIWRVGASCAPLSYLLDSIGRQEWRQF